MYVYIYIYIYIEREREIDRQMSYAGVLQREDRGDLHAGARKGGFSAAFSNGCSVAFSNGCSLLSGSNHAVVAQSRTNEQ